MPTLYDNFERVRQYIDQHQADVDLSSYVSKDELSAQSYLTSIPSEYVTQDELSANSYLTQHQDISGKADKSELNSYLSITNFTKPAGVDVVQLKKVGLDIHATNGTIYPHYYSTYAQADAITDGTCWLSHGTMKNWVNGRLAEIEASYITSSDVSAMGYMTQADSYAYLSIENLRTNNNRPVQLRATGLQFISSNYTIAPREISYEYINTSAYNNAWIGNTTLKNYVNGRLAEIEASYVTTSDLNNYLPLSGGTVTGDLTVSKNIIGSSDIYLARQKEDGPAYLWLGSNRPWKVWENNQEIAVTANTNNKNFTFAGYNTTAGFYRVFTVNENETRANSKVTAWSQIVHEYPTYHKGVTYEYNTVYSYNIIPCETDTYTLGDGSYFYNRVYTNRIQGASTVNIIAGGNNRATFSTTALRPMQQNYNLGSSDYPFATAYISNIYNFIWTGTSAEYAALDNYTSYQIYMIKEA